MGRLTFNLVIVLLLTAGCSNDDIDEIRIFENLQATVRSGISCRTSSFGLVNEIELDETLVVSDSLSFERIGIINLPENLTSEDTRIRITVKQSGSVDGLCVDIYSPDYFFENISISEVE